MYFGEKNFFSYLQQFEVKSSTVRVFSFVVTISWCVWDWSAVPKAVLWEVHLTGWPPRNMLGENCCFIGPRCPALPSPKAHRWCLSSCEPNPFSQEAYGVHHRHLQNSDYSSPHSSHCGPNPVITSILVLLHGPFLSVPSHGSIFLRGSELQGGRDLLLYPDNYSPWGRKEPPRLSN